MTDTPTNYRSILDSIPPGLEVAPIHIPPDWVQGRATFGGLVAAAALRAMQAQVTAGRYPRALQITFVGPVAPGEAAVHTRKLREGKSTTVVESHVVQGGGVCAVIVGSFGADRQSEVTVEAPPRPEAVSPDELAELPYLPGVTPTFTQHFVYRYALGDFPFSGSKQAVMGGWCKYRFESRAANQEDILGLVDAWPPTVLPMMTTPAPGSSLTWTISFLNWNPEAQTDQWWFYRAETDAAANGYASTRAILWDPEGRPAAVSSQTVAIFG
jgi:acyl-CoA thioesterase